MEIQKRELFDMKYNTHKQQNRITIVTSIHPDFDSRIWKHATSLANNGYDVHLVCPWKVDDSKILDGVTFHPFKKIQKRWQRPLLVPFRVLNKLFPLLKKVDLVHFHDIDLLPWMAMFSIIKPVVYDVHENYAEEMLVRRWIPKFLRRLLYYVVLIGQFVLSQIIRNVVLVVPSQDKEFNNHRINKIHIRNYASLALLNDVVDNYIKRDNIIVFIGSQHKNNGSLFLLDIAERLCKVCPDTRIYASDRFSDLRFRDRVISEIRHRGLDGFVKLVTNVKPPEIMSVLNRAIIGISPNLRVTQQIHGIHTKLFEYMAAGLPVVASDLPHQIDVIEGNRAGLLARPEDPDSFVKAIQSLVLNRKWAMKLGQNGQLAFKERYSWESQIPALLNFYEQILAKKRNYAIKTTIKEVVE